MIENGQNTEKSPGDLGGLSISQILVEDHQFTLMWKNLKDSKKNDDSEFALENETH